VIYNIRNYTVNMTVPSSQPLNIEKIDIDKMVIFKDIKYDEQKLVNLYDMLIKQNPYKFGANADNSGGKELRLLIPMPRDQQKKEELYNILAAIDKTINVYVASTTVDNTIDEYRKLYGVDFTNILTPKDISEIKSKMVSSEDALKLKHALTQSVAIDIFVAQDSFANSSTIDKSALDFRTTKKLVTNGGWWLGMLPLFMIEIPLKYIRDNVFMKYGKVTFDEVEDAREMLRKKRLDAEEGVKNEFSLLSAFVGTEAQKTAAQSAIIIGVASTCWTIVGKIQQNPALAAVIMGAVSATGVGGLALGGALIACGVAYYAVLKLKEKYNTYYEINRSLNELTILLHRIQKLIRLSVLISNTYNFDIAINEIVEQLKILFSRFDEMLKQDDYNGIQGMINANATPDIDLTAVVAKAAAEAVKENADNQQRDSLFDKVKASYNKAKERIKNATKSVTDALSRAGKNIGSFVYVMTFDQELWYKKLNNDIIKLNIFLTTTIGEFNLVLNVLQMGYITKGLKGDKDSITLLEEKQKHIQDSSEYMRMLIGILLNDILKLRVNLSYCTRTNTAAIVKVSTKDESVCLTYQEENGGAIIVTTYRRLLHSMILTLVERLNDPNSVYSTSRDLKTKVEEEVIKPYIQIFQSVKAGVPPDVITAFREAGVKLTLLNKDFFTKKFDETKAKLESKLNKEDVQKKFDLKKKNEIMKLKGEKPTPTPQGGGWRPWSKDTSTTAQGNSSSGSSSAPTTTTAPAPASPAVENDDSKLNKLMDATVEYIVTEPYVTIPDKELSEFLNKVYEFSKKEGKTTEAETKEAIATAKKVAEIVPDGDYAGQALKEQNEANALLNSAVNGGEQSDASAGKKPDGGRRLTRRRSFKPKKNRRNTRGLKKMQAYPFKSAAAALKAYHRK
jgi:hypothetical protein